MTAAAFGLALALPALAQFRQPTDEEVARATKQYRQPSAAEVERAHKRYRTRPDTALDRAAATQSPLHLDAIPMPKGRVDVEALARAYEQHRPAFETAEGHRVRESELLVFVTLDMPEPALRALVDQAARTQAVMVLRGLVNASIRQTAARVQQLLGHTRVEWRIDPQAFDRFGVDQAPTFVLVQVQPPVQACASGACVAPQSFVSIAGDVSIDYALEAIERRAPRLARETQRLLKRIRG